MNKILIITSFAVIFTAFNLYAQMMPAPVPPAEPYYNEVYTVSECLGAYEGTTCIISGTITAYDNSYHRDRYILKDNTGEISVRLSHHVIGKNNNIIGGNFKVTGELRGSNNHIDNHHPKKHHADDIHIAVRYIEKQ